MAKVITVLRDALSAAQADIERLEKELIQARAVVDGLTYAIAREQRPKPRAQPNPNADGDWGTISKIAAVERVLRTASSPLSPSEIARELASHGRDDTAAGVSASLSRLKREDRAEQAGYSKWSAKQKPSGLPQPDRESQEPQTMGSPSGSVEPGAPGQPASSAG